MRIIVREQYKHKMNVQIGGFQQLYLKKFDLIKK
jgi:hypothetical protein